MVARTQSYESRPENLEPGKLPTLELLNRYQAIRRSIKDSQGKIEDFPDGSRLCNGCTEKISPDRVKVAPQYGLCQTCVAIIEAAAHRRHPSGGTLATATVI